MEIKNLNQYIYRINRLSIKNFSKQKFLVFDLEATGFDVKREYITQIGCAPIINGKIKIKDKFSSFIYSPKNIPAKISRLTGITNQQVKTAPNLGVILQKLWSLYYDFIWTAQCGFEFDFPIMQNNVKRLGITYFNPKTIDTKVIFAYLHPEIDAIFSTDFLKKYYNVKFSDLKRHDALSDSILIGRVLQKMLNDFIRVKGNDLIIKRPIIIKKFVPKPLKYSTTNS